MSTATSPALPYINLDIHIEPRPSGYRVLAASEPAGEASADFGAHFDDIDFDLLRGTITTTSRTHLITIGKRLFDGLFQDDVRTSFDRVLAVARERGCKVRLRLDLTDAPELANLPWEALYDAQAMRFLTQSSETSLVRYLKLGRSADVVTSQPPLRVLVVIAAPTDLPTLNTIQEWTQLKADIADLEARGTLTLELLDNVTPAALQRALRQGTYHILHFIGHSDFDESTQAGFLMFVNEAGLARPTGSDWLGPLLSNNQTLRLVVLNSCAGARTSPRDAFAGMAQALIGQGVPAVIAMQEAITDSSAGVFSHEFYAALAAGLPVDSALAESRIAIARDSSEWLIPVLYMRDPDGQLFALRPESQKETPQRAWHLTGLVALGFGALAYVLLIGLGYVLLDPYPLLRNTIAIMATGVGGLFAFFGISGQQVQLRYWSHVVGKIWQAQVTIGALFVLIVVLWGKLGLPAVWSSACDPVLGCKEAQTHWYLVEPWQASPPPQTEYEQILVNSTQANLDQKLSRIPVLHRVPQDRAAKSEKVREAVDIWIKGSYQSLNGPTLTAEITKPASGFLRVVEITGTPDEVERATQTCLLDLQDHLALEILKTLEISPTTDLIDTMRRTPTSSCEALKLNNDAAALLVDLTNLERARLMLEKAVQIDPQYADAQNNLGYAYERKGDFANAIAHYQQAIDLLENPVFYFNLARAHIRNNELAAAVAANKTAIQLDPTYAEAYNNLGFTYLRMNELGKAFTALQTGLQLDEHLPALHKNLGRVLLEQGKPVEAIPALTRAVDLLNGSYAEALYYLALAHHKMGDDATACATLELYLPLAQGDAPDRMQSSASWSTEWHCAHK